MAHQLFLHYPSILDHLFLGLLLPPKAERDRRPPVLAIRANKSGELMILSPEYTEPDSK
jgi:hypothetical protein